MNLMTPKHKTNHGEREVAVGLSPMQSPVNGLTTTRFNL